MGPTAVEDGILTLSDILFQEIYKIGRAHV